MASLQGDERKKKKFAGNATWPNTTIVTLKKNLPILCSLRSDRWIFNEYDNQQEVGGRKKRGKELWLTCWEIRWKRSWCKWPPSNNQTPQHHFEWNFSWYQEMTPTSLSFSFPPTRTKVWTNTFTVVDDVSSQTHHEAESWQSHKIIHKVLSASGLKFFYIFNNETLCRVNTITLLDKNTWALEKK